MGDGEGQMEAATEVGGRDIAMAVGFLTVWEVAGSAAFLVECEVGGGVSCGVGGEWGERKVAREKGQLRAGFSLLDADRWSQTAILSRPVPPLAPLRVGFGVGVPDELSGRAGRDFCLGCAIGRDFHIRRPQSPFGGGVGGLGWRCS